MSNDHELCVIASDEIRRIPLPRTGALHIGRAEGNEVRIEHPSVSRRHALLEVGEGFTIRDLGGANGTFVRGAERPAEPGATENLRQLSNEDSPLTVGEPVVIGVITLVVRRTDSEQPAFADLTDAGGESKRFIVREPAMKAVYEQAALAARALISVLVLGETGVGKEVLARSIHARSARASGPFLGVNCAALAESILESELFGHEKGAFTGALQTRPGLFEAADGGTVFLDEVGELPLSTQAKLLRVLEERTVTRLGARAPRPVDVRFVAATNRDLEAAVAAGKFRGDLYFRLNGISLLIPPLRERQTEIEPLARSFVTAACRDLDRAQPLALGEQALARLLSYEWPGNVRELKNVIDRAVVLCPGDTISLEHLPPQLLSPRRVSERPPNPELGTSDRAEALKTEIRDLERARIAEALAQCGGNQTEAAKVLGISRRTLVSRLAEYNLPRPRLGR